MPHRILASLLILSFVGVIPAQEPAKKPLGLTAEDRQLFEQLFQDGLFDPKDAVWTKVLVQPPGFSEVFTTPRFAWKKGERIYHTNGVVYQAECVRGAIPDDLERPVDQALEKLGDRRNDHGPDLGSPGGIPDPPYLALAAWCYRQGKEDKAQALLVALKDRASRQGTTTVLVQGRRELVPNDLRGRFHHDLTWITFHGMITAFQYRQDAEALEQGELLMARFTKGLQVYEQAQVVIDDLKRRKRDGDFNRPLTTATPLGYADWSSDAKARFWIKQFQEINLAQLMDLSVSSPGSPGGDARVKQIIALGEDALPALFECMEKDTRLMRHISFRKSFMPRREVHYVREAACVAVYGILKTIQFEQEIPYDLSGPERYKRIAAEARKYWLANQAKSPLSRWYDILCDVNASAATRQSAMRSLLNLSYGWMTGPPWPPAGVKLPEQLESFTNPTVAEAMLRSWDHDLEAGPEPGRPRDTFHLIEYAHHLEDAYLRSLVVLGDRRVVPELTRREQAAGQGIRLRLKLAYALHLLGDSKALANLAEQIAAGQEPKAPFPGMVKGYIRDTDAITFIHILITAQLPETDKALWAITKTNHPLHAFFKGRFDQLRTGNLETSLSGHPYCLAFIRPLLNDTTPTGGTFSVVKNDILERSGQLQGHSVLYQQLRDSGNRREQAEGRICDTVMGRLWQFVVGLPFYHPLLKDAPEQFERNVKWLDQHTFRRVTPYENEKFVSGFGYLMPDLKPMDRPATAADVAASRAVFHLDGQGKVINMKLPAWVVLKKDLARDNVRRRGLVFQAEEVEGRKQYGALFKEGVAVVKEDEVLRIEAYEPGAKTR